MGAPAALSRCAAVLVLALGCAGCAARSLPEPRAAEPDSTLIGVPFESARDVGCGPASLAMALRWSGAPADPNGLAQELTATRMGGALRVSLLASARRRGRLAFPIRGAEELLRELQDGHPVVVMENLGLSWLPYWHYALVIGYDRARETVVLHSADQPSYEVSFSVFDRSWERAERWGIVVLRPDTIPASATESRFLEAAVGLERAGRAEAAQSAYAAAVRRWPASLGGWIGLGNASHALGDLPGAERAFRRAVALHPESAAAHQNLRFVSREIDASGDRPPGPR